MTTEQWIALLSVIALIFSSIGKIYWASEYTKAKNATIDNLKEQIKMHEAFALPKMKEYFDAVKAIHEARIESINLELEKANSRIEELEQPMGGQIDLQALEAEKEDLGERVKILRNEVGAITAEREKVQNIASEMAGLSFSKSVAEIIAKSSNKYYFPSPNPPED